MIIDRSDLSETPARTECRYDQVTKEIVSFVHIQDGNR